MRVGRIERERKKEREERGERERAKEREGERQRERERKSDRAELERVSDALSNEIKAVLSSCLFCPQYASVCVR